MCGDAVLKPKCVCFSSPVSNQPLLSESVASSQGDSTSADKAAPETEDLQGLHTSRHLLCHLCRIGDGSGTVLCAYSS